MPLQSGKRVSVRYKAQSALGSPASGSGGKELPYAPSAGFSLAKVAIADPTVRADGQTLIGRHGSRSLTGSYDAPLRLNALNELFEAVLRTSAVATSTLSVSITTTTSTIVRASGSWLTDGVRRGMVIRLSGHTSTGNNDRNLTVTNVTTTDITVAEALTLNGTPDSADIILPRYYAQAATPTDRYFTVEEYHADIDQSEVATDCVISSLAVSLQPDNTAMLTFGIVGRNETAEATGSSPVLTSPTEYQTIAMVAVDASLVVGGTAVLNVSGLDFTYDLGAATVPVVGSVISPDVFKNNATLEGSFSALRENLTALSAFLNETEFGIVVTMVEPEASPISSASTFRWRSTRATMPRSARTTR